jgi:hypothetical protein
MMVLTTSTPVPDEVPARLRGSPGLLQVLAVNQ